jgi:hypothetical protein
MAAGGTKQPFSVNVTSSAQYTWTGIAPTVTYGYGTESVTVGFVVSTIAL